MNGNYSIHVNTGGEEKKRHKKQMTQTEKKASPAAGSVLATDGNTCSRKVGDADEVFSSRGC